MKSIMKIEEIEIGKLKDYANNPRHNENAVDAVAASIEEFGFKVPIIIDKDYVIVAGHTRKKAAEKLGLKTAPCIIADDLTPEQIKAFRLVDNRTSEFAEWDFEKLEEEYSKITNLDMSKFELELEEMVENYDDYFVDVEPKEDKEVKCPHCGGLNKKKK